MTGCTLADRRVVQLTLVYTLVGGLKATFLASYFHTALIFIILILMVTITCARRAQQTLVSKRIAYTRA